MKHAFLGLGLLFLAGALLPQRQPVRAAGKPLVVVVGASSTSKDIDIGTLRRAFEGLPSVLDGKRLIPVNHANNTPLRVAFDRQILRLEPGDVGKFWIDKRIRDEGAPPKTVPSPDLAVRLAASVPGIITYASAELVNASVKVLTVGGKSPSDSGYPLTQ